MKLNLGQLNVLLSADITKFTKNMDKATKKLDNFADKAQKMGKKLTTSLTLPLTGLGVAAVKMASDFNESLNKMEVAFGRSFGDARRQIDQLADSMNRSRKQMVDFAADTQAFLAPLIGSKEAAADMSLAISALAVDLGSFFNIADSDALTKLISGLAGETEAVRRLGVDLSQTRLEQEAFQMGINKTFDELTQSEKVLLRFNAIMEDTAQAQGDSVRTANSLANQWKGLKANVTDLAIEIGQELMPYALAAVQWARDMTDRIRELSPEAKTLALRMALLAAALGPAVVLLGIMTSIASKAVNLFTKLGGVLLPLLKGIATVAGGPELLGLMIAKWLDPEIAKDMEKNWQISMEKLRKNKTIDEFFKWLEEKAAPFKELTDLFSFEIDEEEIKKSIEEMENAYAKWIEEMQKNIAELLGDFGDGISSKAGEEAQKISDTVMKEFAEAVLGISVAKGYGSQKWYDTFLFAGKSEEEINNLVQSMGDFADTILKLRAQAKTASILGEPFDKKQYIVNQLQAYEEIIAEFFRYGIKEDNPVMKWLLGNAQELREELKKLEPVLSEEIVKILKDTASKLRDLEAGNTLSQMIANALGEEFDLRGAKIDTITSAINKLQNLGLTVNHPAIQMLIDKLDELKIGETNDSFTVLNEKILEMTDIIGEFNSETADGIRKFQKIIGQINDAPDILRKGFAAIREEVASMYNGGVFGNFMGSLAGAYVGYQTFGTSGNKVGAITGMLAGLGLINPIFAIGSAIIGGLVPKNPINQSYKELQARINEMNEILAEWGATYRSPNVWFKNKAKWYKKIFGGEDWKTYGKEAAQKGAEIAEQLINSMEQTFASLSQGLSQALFQGISFEDFGQFVGSRLQQVLFESLLETEAIKKPLQKLSAFIAEAVSGGLTQGELDKINELARTVYDSIAPWSDTAEKIAEEFGLAEEAAQGIGRALRNVPTGFKIALTSFDVAQPVPMASGGIVTQPTLALVGESGPEAVIPLSEINPGVTVQITVNGNIYADDFEQRVERAVSKATRRSSLALHGLAGAGA